MANNNVKLGYAYSLALHILIAIAMFAWALIDVLFPKEAVENKLVFEMIEPSENPPAPPSPPTAPDTPKIEVEKVEKIDPIDIPEPEPTPPEPEPTPPEPTPTPPKDDTPVVKPKPKPTPPKKVDFSEWKKKNKDRATNRSNTTPPKRKAVQIGPITSNHSSINSISDIKSPASSSMSNSAMRDAFAEYTNAIYIIAKRNWKRPMVSSDISTLSAKVTFRVSKNGIISNVRIIESSGDKDFDNSVIQVFKIITIPPPPDNASHNVNITFRGR